MCSWLKNLDSRSRFRGGERVITEINTSFRVLGLEMKLVDAQYKRPEDA